jgi:sugar lactone lactonase YvrE
MKKRNFLVLFPGIFLFIQLSPAQNFQSEKLVKIWEVNGLSVPESVLPVPEEGILYVSNIGLQNQDEKESGGFISIIDTNGRVLNLKWAEGLKAPKGMAIVRDRLFVTEVDRIGEIELTSGKKLNEYPVPGAVFLNDMAADREGRLYISDSRTGTVYTLAGGEVAVFLKSGEFPNPNGVVVDQGFLILGTGEKIVRIDLSTKVMTDFMIHTGGVDGLALTGEGRVIFSDWPGTVHLMKQGEEKELILDTTSSKTSKTADFGYDPGKQMIYIPTFFDNSVICYRLELEP